MIERKDGFLVGAWRGNREMKAGYFWVVVGVNPENRGKMVGCFWVVGVLPGNRGKMALLVVP